MSGSLALRDHVGLGTGQSGSFDSKDQQRRSDMLAGSTGGKGL